MVGCLCFGSFWVFGLLLITDVMVMVSFVVVVLACWFGFGLVLVYCCGYRIVVCRFACSVGCGYG